MRAGKEVTINWARKLIFRLKNLRLDLQLGLLLYIRGIQLIQVQVGNYKVTSWNGASSVLRQIVVVAVITARWTPVCSYALKKRIVLVVVVTISVPTLSTHLLTPCNVISVSIA